MSKTNQLFTSIVDEFTYRKKHPSIKRILSYLFSLEVNNFRSDFVDLVGRTIHFNPKFFMESLYTQFRERLGKTCGDERRRELERQILEEFCLYKGEQIGFECEGTVKKKVPKGYKLEVSSGNIFVTKQRIITEGKLEASSSKHDTSKRNTREPSSIFLTAQLAIELTKTPSPSAPKTPYFDAKKAVLYYSIQEESPCYGYVFPITLPCNLGINKNSVLYDDEGCIMEISSPSFKERENMDLLIDVLEKIQKELISEHKVQEDCPKCSLSRKIKLSRCSWCGKIFHEE
ncbi:MAG: hypothetical protein ACFFCI_13535 [Promethearchaeota archaeon]